VHHLTYMHDALLGLMCIANFIYMVSACIIPDIFCVGDSTGAIRPIGTVAVYSSSSNVVSTIVLLTSELRSIDVLYSLHV